MSGVSQVESLRKLLREQGLGPALPVAANKAYPPASTGFPALDELLAGGIPRGHMTEFVGQSSSGRTSVVFALLAESTARGEVVAYIDASDSFDPKSAQQAGIALPRVLWVRCGQSVGVREKQGIRYQVSGVRERQSDISTAWQAVNLVASAGGFGVIVLDLGSMTKYKLRIWQSRQWLRLRRAIEHSPTAVVVLASEPVASTVSALVLEVAREKTSWEGTPGVSLWLRGISVKVRICQQRKNGTSEGREKTCQLAIGE